jgi:hypothetical protein
MAGRLCRDQADIQRLREKELAVLLELGSSYLYRPYVMYVHLSMLGMVSISS